MKEYSKPPLSVKEQVELLKSRGLLIKNEENAAEILKQLNYYRISAYCLPFEQVRHKFKTGIYFDDIVFLYEFDRKLRFVIDEALEVIEVALRTKLAYYLSRKYGAFAHEDKNHFFLSHSFDHSKWLEKVHEETKRSKETFVQHYKLTYEGFPKIPVWMAVEVMSFSSLSKIFHNMCREDQVILSKEFNLHHRVLASWLHTFTYVRNICAHHSRLWNKEMAIAMEKPKQESWKFVNSKRVSSVLMAVNQILKHIVHNNRVHEDWLRNIQMHLSAADEKPFLLRGMGFEEDFKVHDIV